MFLYVKVIKNFFGGIVRDNSKCENCIYYKYYKEHNEEDG